MDPLSKTPTSPWHYAAISAAYATGVAAAARAAAGRPVPPPAEVLPLGLATFALARTISEDKVESWVRAPFVAEGDDGPRPRGAGMRYAVGELVTCSRCTGAWVALGLVALRTRAPRAGRLLNTVLGAVAVNDFLQAAFAHERHKANEQEARAEAAEAAPERRLFERAPG